MTVFTGTIPTFVAGTAAGVVAQLNTVRDALKSLTEASTSYTPSWTASAGSPSVGNGTLVGKYRQSGKWVEVRIELTVGTTTTFGTAGAAWRFTAPVAPTSTKRHRWLGTAYDSGTADYPIYFRWISGGPYFEVVCDATTAGNPDRLVTDTVPFAWANGDTLVVQFAYEVA